MDLLRRIKSDFSAGFYTGQVADGIVFGFRPQIMGQDSLIDVIIYLTDGRHNGPELENGPFGDSVE